MSQRLTLDESDFKKLCRGEVVTQGALQCALDGSLSHQQMFDALGDAITGLREDTEEIRRWIHGINQAEPVRPGGFLEAFAAAVCRADQTNYPILRPALLALMAKFPKYRFSGVL